MKTIDLFRFTLKNIRNSKIKGILCALSVCVGISSVCLVMEIGSNAENQIQQELSQISSNILTVSPNSGKVSGTVLKEISQNPAIKAYMPYIFEYGHYFVKNTTNNSVICGINQDIPEIFNITLYHGRLPTKSEVEQGANVVLVDDIMANNIYHRTNIVGKTIQIALNGFYQKYEVIGVISSQKAGIESMIGQSLPDLLYVPYTTINQAFGENKLENVAIRCFDSFNPTEESQKLIRKLNISTLSEGKYSVDNISNFTDTILRVTTIVSLLVSAIAAISVLVGGIGIMNSLVASAESRKNEIGIYIALGAKPREIMLSFLLEAVLISVIGSVLGIAISSAAVLIANQFISIPLTLNPMNSLVSFVGAIVCGAVFGYMPSKKAAKLNPIDAIRLD